MMMMSQCRKFAPNIFHKSKCSNCFRQKEEHTAEALECNRASRSIARSGYLFVAPDWDFSVPLNRTKRWQRRWFVLYDDGELNYSVDEHPDTIPQGSVDMSKVLEVTGAEQVTGHPHSLALTSPDRVTFVKAASREDARWWAELLAVFPRRHKRNATFPGGRASPSLPQLGRSASPQPPRPRHLSVPGPSPRANFETPPLKEERESPPNETSNQAGTGRVRSGLVPERHGVEHTPPLIRKDYLISSGSPPTRDKLRCDDKARVRRDWRNERLRDIATALTDRSPESSLVLPSEGLLHLKKGWLWLKRGENEWARRWTVLCGPTLNVYRDQDEHGVPEISVELSTVTGYTETSTTNDAVADANKYGFQIEWAGPVLRLSAVTQGIRSNWMQALKMAVASVDQPTAPKSMLLFSSDDEYRTASEGGRRESGDWSELPPSPPLNRLAFRARQRPRLPRCQSRQSTLDSTSTDELDGLDPVLELQKQLSRSGQEIVQLENQIAGLKQRQSESARREQTYQDLLAGLEERNATLAQEQEMLQRRLAENEDKYRALRHEWQKTMRLTQDVDVDRLNVNELKDYCLELRGRLDKAVKEVRTLKLTLKRSEEDHDRLELTNHSLKAGLESTKREHQSEVALLVARLDYLTARLNRAEKARRRSLTLEDKVEELEAKMTNLEAKRRSRRFRRKSLDGSETGRKLELYQEEMARRKVEECLNMLDGPAQLEEALRELQVIVGGGDEEVEVVSRSVSGVVDQLQRVLLTKLTSLEEGRGLEVLAEKMAFERVIIARIQQALQGPSSRLAEKEARETGHLILALERKLQGQCAGAAVPTAKTSAAYLTKVLTKYFLSLGQDYQSLKPITLKPHSPSLQSLLEQQRKLDVMYQKYRDSKLALLAGGLDRLAVLTSQIARRVLIEKQLSQALLKAARTYQTHYESDQINCFAFYASERAALELWHDSVTVRLRQEIDTAVTSLVARATEPVAAHCNVPVEELVREFADVVAHKALIDARIDVLTGRFKAELRQSDVEKEEGGRVRTWFEERRCVEELRDETGLVGAELEAEFVCMFDQSLAALGGFDEVVEHVTELQSKLDEFQRVGDCDGADLALIDRWNDVCQKCQTLRDSLERMRRLIGDGGSMRGSASRRDQRTHSGTEYLSQVEHLRVAYRCALAACTEPNQEAAIERLQLLCDKVLHSMDQSHRRTIQQLRDAHAQQVEQLRRDKEQALTEETQATLAALDAMRKAHVAEVQREVARFKQEYARQQRDELADLSERLSAKALEAATLEDQLGSATRQLAHAQQRILHLERNPQLSSMQN